MHNSHASLTRSRAQLQRRSRELTVARDRFLETLRGYEGRLMELATSRLRGDMGPAVRMVGEQAERFGGRIQAILDRIIDRSSPSEARDPVVQEG